MPRNRILVIDDEPSINDALRLVLTELGHDVDSAKNGDSAKELLKLIQPRAASNVTLP